METEENSVPEPEGAPPGPLRVGERIEGRLAELGQGAARLALSDGRSVSIEAAELVGETAAELGEVISAFVVRIDPGGEVWVSRAKGSAAVLLLLNARDHGQTVEGRIVAQGPSGLEIDLGGGIFAICPPSEIGNDVDNPGHLVGQTGQFKVKEVSEAQVVLSRKAALPETPRGGDTEADERQAEDAADVRRRLRPGAVMAGRITRIREFGAFVDLGGGVEGLVHLSELSHDRISSPKEVVQPGQPVEVQVLKVDYDAHKGERISLSLKALAKSAWELVLAQVKVGEQRSGTVKRIEPFGAFVELAPGVTGLVHVSAMGAKRHAPPSDLLKVDDEVLVEVLGIDSDKHRISLRRVPGEAEVAERRAAQQAIRQQKKAEALEKREEARKKPHERLKPGDVVDGTVDRIEPYGFFLQLKGGGRGMVHVSEMGAAPEGVEAHKPVAEQFPKGTKIKVAVLEIDPEHRIRLSRAAVAELEKGSTAEAYLKHKSQRELEEKLLRSASKPARPRPEGRRPRVDGKVSPAQGKKGPGPVAEPAAGPGASATGGSPGGTKGQPRRERPPPRREGGSSFTLPKSPGLGTLGDLLKAKLQQRKN